MKSFKTQNPYTLKDLEEYELYDDKQLENILESAESQFKEWQKQDIKDRIGFLKELANVIFEQKVELADLITSEMGKPISESLAEIEKCIFLCDFYIKNAEKLLADAIIETDADQSFISYDPLGVILAVMPWNYPFWQVMRFAVPTLTAGNTAILKHSTNTTGCSLKIEELFKEAGYPVGCFSSVLCNHEQMAKIIEDNRIKAVTLTGSEKAGKSIAEQAGKNLKKTVLELGGNNACIVLEDADLDAYLDVMVKARMQNTGQSCIAAKRFIVVDGIYDEFVEKFKSKVEDLKQGNPTDENVEFSVLARPDLAEDLKKQVDKSVKMGAKVLIGNSRKDAYFAPTILVDVKPGMPVFDEETFGPVAALIRANDADDAFKIASDSRFGLGSMVFSKNTDAALKRTLEIKDGAYFINEMVKSDPRLPFGGTKASGYGRELSKEGILEFVNKKTVYLKK